MSGVLGPFLKDRRKKRKRQPQTTPNVRPGDWVCPDCTFAENLPNKRFCTMCNRRRPTPEKPRPPSTTAIAVDDDKKDDAPSSEDTVPTEKVQALNLSEMIQKLERDIDHSIRRQAQLWETQRQWFYHQWHLLEQQHNMWKHNILQQALECYRIIQQEAPNHTLDPATPKSRQAENPSESQASTQEPSLFCLPTTKAAVPQRDDSGSAVAQHRRVTLEKTANRQPKSPEQGKARSPTSRQTHQATKSNQTTAASHRPGWISNQPARNFLQELELQQQSIRASQPRTKKASKSSWQTATRPKQDNDIMINEDDMKEPGHAYQERVRSKADREKLPAHDCAECRRFYQAMDASQDPLQFCRHRSRHAPAETPVDFWELDFIDERNARLDNERAAKGAQNEADHTLI